MFALSILSINELKLFKKIIHEKFLICNKKIKFIIILRGMMNEMNGLFEKYEKYAGYYNLCEEGRNVLREAAEKICADENLCIEAVGIKNRLTDVSVDFDCETEFKNKSAQFGAFVFTLAIEDMEKFYKEKNIPHDILLATVSDLPIWIYHHRNWYNEWGFATYGWLINHVRGKIFRLGRLQFEMAKIGDWNMPPEELRLDLKEGDRLLGVHIPRDGKLYEAACLDSFDRAKEFFSRYFNYKFKAFSCFSWLFDPAFKDLLPPDSNIIKFQRLFVTFPRGGENYGGLFYIFENITKENIKDAPTDTYFRKKIVEHILSGGIMQGGGGYRMV